MCMFASAKFSFEDTTLISQLRCCNETDCVNLADGNETGIDVTNCYEIGAEKLQIDIYSFVMNNFLVIVNILMLIVVMYIAYKYIR